MYCPKCGKENPEGARFCMHCGADFSGYKVEISPKIDVSPKISVSAKVEGVPYPKWKPNVDEYAKIKGQGELPVYKKFAEFDGKSFCPQCGNYDSLEYIGRAGSLLIQGDKYFLNVYELYNCLACNKLNLKSCSTVQFFVYETLEACKYIKTGTKGRTIRRKFNQNLEESDIVIFNRSLDTLVCPFCGEGILTLRSGDAYFYEPDHLNYDKYNVEFLVREPYCYADVKRYNVHRCSQCKYEIYTSPFTERFDSREWHASTKIEAAYKLFLSLIKTGGTILVNTNDVCDVCRSTPYATTCPHCGMKFCFSCYKELSTGFFSSSKCPKCGSKVPMGY